MDFEEEFAKAEAESAKDKEIFEQLKNLEKRLEQISKQKSSKGKVFYSLYEVKLNYFPESCKYDLIKQLSLHGKIDYFEQLSPEEKKLYETMESAPDFSKGLEANL